MEKLCLTGEIDEYTKVTICEMSEKVIKHLAHKYQNVQKEVVRVMGGKVLDHEAKRIYLRGENHGKIEGKIEEARENALELFKNGASFEMVEKSIKSLSYDELLEIYNQVNDNNFCC